MAKGTSKVPLFTYIFLWSELICMILAIYLEVAYFIDQLSMYINLYSHIQYGQKDQISISLV